MESATTSPRTLQEAIVFFSNPDNCITYMVSRRWANGVTCPYCQSTANSYYASQRLWRCAGCKKRFSLKIGTIMEDSPLGLDKWLTAIWMITNAKNGISSYEIHRAIGITQKSAWFVLQRIRLALRAGSIEKKLCGSIVEIDETYVGGKERNKHRSKRTPGTGGHGKAIVMGLLERGGKIRTKVVADTKTETFDSAVREHVEPGTEIHTDMHASYRKLSDEYIHKAVDHAIEYVRDNVHTNCLENFWSLLKRTIYGTYVSVSPQHLHRYVETQAFRYNHRKMNDGQRFSLAMGGTVGRRLTYKQLIGAK